MFTNYKFEEVGSRIEPHFLTDENEKYYAIRVTDWNGESIEIEAVVSLDPTNPLPFQRFQELKANSKFQWTESLNLAGIEHPYSKTFFDADLYTCLAQIVIEDRSPHSDYFIHTARNSVLTAFNWKFNTTVYPDLEDLKRQRREELKRQRREEPEDFRIHVMDFYEESNNLGSPYSPY